MAGKKATEREARNLYFGLHSHGLYYGKNKNDI